ncbi:MAG: hypothetical protein ABGX10_04935 [Paracoccus sp. (in: a-proteobacteria)]|uniref:hypothetical protein n=1 Tax=Paracoccus sp. TaxID=267 RepID=UPI0032422C78
MTKAILKLKEKPQMEGEAEKGGDYVRLLISGDHAPESFTTPSHGKLEMDGDATQVVLESASPASDGAEGTLLTMRRFTPPI